MRGRRRDAKFVGCVAGARCLASTRWSRWCALAAGASILWGSLSGTAPRSSWRACGRAAGGRGTQPLSGLSIPLSWQIARAAVGTALYQQGTLENRSCASSRPPTLRPAASPLGGHQGADGFPQGAGDRRVAWQTALQFDTAMKAAGNTVTLTLYPGATTAYTTPRPPPPAAPWPRGSPGMACRCGTDGALADTSTSRRRVPY